MSFTETLLRLEHLAHLVKIKNTGTRDELAQRLNVSVRTVDNLMQLLRDHSIVTVYFCTKRRSYCFEGEVELQFLLVVRAADS